MRGSTSGAVGIGISASALQRMGRHDPEWWTADSWAKVYSFRKEGKGMAGRTDKLTDGKLRTSINPKNGYVVADCVDSRKNGVLEFVMLSCIWKSQARLH